MQPPSVLSTTSGVLRLLIFLNRVLGLLILALLGLSYGAPDWTFRALGVGPIAGHEGLVAGMRAIMGIGLAAVPITELVLDRLWRIVGSVHAGEAFTTDNAARLRTIAWGLLALELLHVAVGVIASAVSTQAVPLRLGGELQPGGWLAVLLLFVLAQVFLEGTRMREDLEGTV